ncbi:transmembrane protein 181-like isoform X2 [Lineus longissimus]|uniref:transmembrane protein 181-like isoform X2 n=1 Tax=Lineus longissimus TaxID=88925 RepID=UPI00315D27D9
MFPSRKAQLMALVQYENVKKILTVASQIGLRKIIDMAFIYADMSVGPLKNSEYERSVQMRLYAMNKRQFVLVFLSFFVFFGITVLVGLVGPPIIASVQHNATALAEPPKDLKAGPFRLMSPRINTYNQQIWITAVVVSDNKGAGKLYQPFVVGIQSRGMVDENTSSQAQPVTHNKTRTLECLKDCKELILLHLGFIDYTHYQITINFYGLEKMKWAIKDVKFFFKMYNAAFTELEIWFRFVFLVLTFLATCLFAHSLRKFSLRDWSIEQKWMSALLPLLLLYNDPIFPLTFLVSSWVPGMFDAIFQATFLCSLLLFWLCIYHGVRQNERHFVKFYLPKLVIVGLIWISAVTLSSWQVYNELQDPTYNYKLDTGNFLGFKIFFFVIGGIYLLYLIYLLIRAYGELRSMPYFDLRLKFTTALMLIVISISITITVLRFGRGILEDNFVSDLSTHYQNSAEFLSFYGLLNFYLYAMAFVYSPSRNALYESHFKDNPALSMLNDSDDEVVYGEDHEETSLTRLPGNKYDSDDER